MLSGHCVLQKKEKRQKHACKETEFLRLKRSKLGVHDFEPLKVIGRGAFGEVRSRDEHRVSVLTWDSVQSRHISVLILLDSVEGTSMM